MNRTGKTLWAWAALISCGIFLCPDTGLANNLRISNLTLEDRGSSQTSLGNYYATAQFDISWDNSWRNETNYDGTWIFFKIYNTASGFFFDAMLDYATGGDGTTRRDIDPERSSYGTNGNLQIEVPVDSGRDPDGFFIYRKSNGSGTIQSSKVRVPVRISSSLQAVDIILYAYAIEMVYIPTAAFYAGDTTSAAAFKQGSSDSDPWYLDSDSTLRTANTASNSFYYSWTGASDEFSDGTVFTIPVSYPLGYSDFWIMKYELTEGQYVDFFNTLGSTAKTNRNITSASGKNSTSVVFRNTFTTDGGSPPISSTIRTDRAMSYISWVDLSAYLDWAKLRPMSEFEYEKAARGPLSPVAGEYAWGSTTLNRGFTFSTSPEDGTETFTDTNANAVYNNTTFSLGDDFLGSAYARGPVRSGIFATNGSSRTAAGAGYYGVMDLTGNVNERVVGVGNTTVLYYWPTNGDGDLDESGSGYALELGWIGLDYPNGSNGVINTPDGVGLKGGGWSELTTSNMRVSDRGYTMSADSSRGSAFGGRGVRGYNAKNPLINCGDGIVQPPEQCDDQGASGGICTAECLCTSDEISTCNGEAPPDG